MLVVLSGLPGVGKTAIARELAVAMGAVHVRIDSIEQALRNEGLKVEGEGYSASRTLLRRIICGLVALSSLIA
jgi:predicted kinase